MLGDIYVYEKNSSCNSDLLAPEIYVPKCTSIVSFLRLGNGPAVRQLQSPVHTFDHLQEMLTRKENQTFTSTHRMGIYAKNRKEY